MLARIRYYLKRKLISVGIIKIRKNPNAVKWGFMGLGSMAEKFSSAIDGNSDAIVQGAASRSLEKAKAFAGRHGNCKAYGSYQEILDDPANDIDVIYIATPVPYHYDNIKQSLLAGKNVLCEKSITSDSKQLEELISLAKQQNCFLMEAMWMKCLPTFSIANKWIKEGRIGEMELIRVNFYKKEIIKPDLSIFNAQKGGGVLLDYGVYAISFMTTFFNGAPEELSFSKHNSYTDVDCDWQIFGKKGEVKAFINISSNFSSESKASIAGSNGTIEWKSQFNRTNVIKLYDKKGNKIDEYSAKYSFEGFEYQIDEVTACLRAKGIESVKVPLLDSLATLAVIDQLMTHKSSSKDAQ